MQTVVSSEKLKVARFDFDAGGFRGKVRFVDSRHIFFRGTFNVKFHYNF